MDIPRIFKTDRSRSFVASAVVGCLLLASLFHQSVTAVNSSGEPLVLTASSFEHETQAATGATTGPWFVKFYAPWCGHCKSLSPTWDELAVELDGQVNVAKVDCIANKSLQTRFAIRGYPTLIFFKDGKMWEYKGARTLEDLKEFALGGYITGDANPVPRMPSWTDQMQGAAKTYCNELSRVLKSFPVPSTVLVGSGLTAGFGFGFILCWLTMASSGGGFGDSQPSKKKRSAVGKAD